MGGNGSHSSGSGTGRDFPSVFSWDWDGKRLIFVGVGRERFENSLPCHPLTGIPLCISSRGLCNAISGSSASALHLGEERGRGTFSTHLPSENPERDSHRSGHGVYVTHAKGTVRAIGH